MINFESAFMKKTLLTALFLVSAAAGFSQKVFSFDSNEKTWDILPNEQAELYIYINNSGSGSINLKYRLLENTCPSQWLTALCDNQNCWSPLPSSGSFLPIVQGSKKASFKLQVDPMNTKGSGRVKIALMDQNDTTLADTCTFNVNLLWNTSVSRIDALSGVWMDAAANTIRTSAVFNGMNAQVADISGKVILEAVVAGSAVPVNAELPAGIYFVRFRDAEGKLLSKKFAVN